MEKQNQVMAEGSWNRTGIFKQVEHIAVSPLFIPDAPTVCGICSA